MISPVSFSPLSSRVVVVVSVLLLSACVSVPQRYDGSVIPSARRDQPPRDPAITAEQARGEAVAAAMMRFYGARQLRVAGRRYNFDCSGSILAAHHSAGFDLTPAYGTVTGDGVMRLWELGQHRDDRAIQVGDVVFWDNTYDRNGSGRLDDELTHAGIVVATNVDRHGTMIIMHHHYREGVVPIKMNLHYPGDIQLNNPMRMRGQRYNLSDPWLAGELYRGTRFLH